MRIGIANGPGWVVGGVEIYLRGLILELLERGHEVGVGFERASSLPNYWPDKVMSFDLSKSGELGIDGYLNWAANIHYVHSLKGLLAWDRLLGHQAPCLYFAHNYLVTCVSGHKSHRLPRVEACSRKMGLPCLLHYFPRRCGGSNPLTMLRNFRHKSARRAWYY